MFHLSDNLLFQHLQARVQGTHLTDIKLAFAGKNF